MKRRLTTLFMAAAFAVGALVAGCDDSSDSSGSMTAEEFVDALIENDCAKKLECCPGGIESFSGDSAVTTMEECKSEAAFFQGFMLATFTDPKVIFDEKKAAACEAAMRKHLDSLECTDSMDDSMDDDFISSECEGFVRGTVDEGGSCDLEIQCKNYMHCVSGKCTVPKPNGEACSDADECESNTCINGTCADDSSGHEENTPITDYCYDPNGN